MLKETHEKKQMLIVFTGTLELGGIERSLLGLLDAIDYEQYDVDLFLYGHHGTLFHLINSHVNLLSEVKELAYLRESFKAKMVHGCYYSALLRIRDGILSKIQKADFDKTWAQIMRKCAPKQQKHYDIAISFFRPFDYISEKVEADIKVGWIHTDYSSIDIDKRALAQDYTKVDKIVAVSEKCKETFVNLFPEFNEKVVVIENILSKTFIEEQANDKIEDLKFVNSHARLKLLSIGRYCTAKNFDNIPEICQYICRKGYDICWYIIGFGEDEPLIREKIKEFHMEERVILLGKKDNPYPYIKACDLYVQPSRYEGKCVAVREAQLLGKPVVITNYETSASQLDDGVDGIIVPMNNENCAKGIMNLLDNQKLQQELVENLSKRDYSNAKEIDKLYQLVN